MAKQRREPGSPPPFPENKTRNQKTPLLLWSFLALCVVILSASFVMKPSEWLPLLAKIGAFCRTQLVEISPQTMALAGAVLVLSLVAVAGTVALFKHARQLMILSSALNRSAVFATQVASSSGSALKVTDDVPFAFCHGLIKPRVFVSTGLISLLEPAEADVVLLHERLHAQRLDPLKIFLAHVITSAFFWLPASKTVRNRFLLNLETRVDDMVAKTQGTPAVLATLSKLLRVQPQLADATRASALSRTEERLDRLARIEISQRPTPWLSRQTALLNASWAVLLIVGGGWMLDEARIVLTTAPFCRMQVV